MIKKIKWHGKNGIDPTWELPPADDFNDYRQFIYDNISFSKILKNLKLHPEECSTGKYSHRMVCPFKFHKNGKERTGSFRFSEEKKTFTCFGCTESGDMLKFLQVYCGGWEQYHLQKLALIAGLIKDGELQVPDNYVEPLQETIKETNQKYLFNAGILLRQYLLDIKHMTIYQKECEWVDQMFIKLDKFFNGIDEDNLEEAKEAFEILTNTINKRKQKRLM